jgi:hypothetical protein
MMKTGALLVVAFGLTTTAVSSATAQASELAYATAPRNDFVVFLDKGNTLSQSALKTVHLAAREARPADIVRLSGSPERTAAVKLALVQDGIPAGMIEIHRGANEALPAAGVPSNPADRRVEIKF